jgi:murein DD-endopeptidase MepM/ murein hydrolase activator NlpD
MRRVPPGRHVFVARDPGASAGDESSLGSLDALPPANLHGYAEWDFSGVPDPVMFRRFLDATDYWFDCSDDSSTGSYDPARECCVVVANDPANATGAVGAGDGEVTPVPGIAPRQAAGPSTPAGADANAQLAQARELEAKLAEEYCTVRLLRASMAGEASARGERVRELGRQARDCINADNPDVPPRASQKLVAAATLLRSMPAPSTPEARNLQREVQALIEQAAVQQAESLASRIRQQGDARGDGAAQEGEPSVHAGEAAGRPANPGRAAAKERLLDTRRALDGDARNIINTRRTSRADARAAVGYHP